MRSRLKDGEKVILMEINIVLKVSKDIKKELLSKWVELKIKEMEVDWNETKVREFKLYIKKIICFKN